MVTALNRTEACFRQADKLPSLQGLCDALDPVVFLLCLEQEDPSQC